MKCLAKPFKLSAGALAAALILSACGGGESTDKVAPTVVITDNVPGATLRIIIPTNTAPLMNWTPADGWKLWRAA